jgi:hypothetical protein
MFAACELLVKEGEQVEDYRSIICGYWGRQPECPFYELMGQEARPTKPAALKAVEIVKEADEVVVDLARARWGFIEAISGREFKMGRLLLIFQALSIGLLIMTVFLGFSVMAGRTMYSSYMHLALTTALVSSVTHAMAAFWIGRRMGR